MCMWYTPLISLDTPERVPKGQVTPYVVWVAHAGGLGIAYVITVLAYAEDMPLDAYAEALRGLTPTWVLLTPTSIWQGLYIVWWLGFWNVTWLNLNACASSVMYSRQAGAQDIAFWFIKAGLWHAWPIATRGPRRPRHRWPDLCACLAAPQRHTARDLLESCCRSSGPWISSMVTGDNKTLLPKWKNTLENAVRQCMFHLSAKTLLSPWLQWCGLPGALYVNCLELFHAIPALYNYIYVVLSCIICFSFLLMVCICSCSLPSRRAIPWPLWDIEFQKTPSIRVLCKVSLWPLKTKAQLHAIIFIEGNNEAFRVPARTISLAPRIPLRTSIWTN